MNTELERRFILSGCRNCVFNDICTPFIKQFIKYYDYCERYKEDEMEESEEVINDKWSEFSYNKYTDSLLDYGEPTEWEKYEENSDNDCDR